jgi:uncharacterized surface protein with fasciclin (FAS1) repeats
MTHNAPSEPPASTFPSPTASPAPPAPFLATIPQAIEANNDLSLFRTLLEVAGLDPYLESPVTRATIFAPTNAVSFGAHCRRLHSPLPPTRCAPAPPPVAAPYVTPLAHPRAPLTLSPFPPLHPSPQAIKKLATAMKLTPEQLIADYNHLLVDRLVGYHVVTTADIKSKAITDGAKITTAGGGELTADLKTKAGAVLIKGAQNSAQVTAADTVVGNVTIHVIDSVLLPATVFPTIKDALAFSPTTSALSAALNKDPKLAKLIADPTTNITLFAPTTAALTALGEDAKAKALLADPVSANKILAYHAMKGARIEPSFMGKGAEVQPTLLEGQSVTISKVRGEGAALNARGASSKAGRPRSGRQRSSI